MSPAAAASSPVLAAGAVCWREAKRGVEILLVYRTQHRDTSLPKGKVDPSIDVKTSVRDQVDQMDAGAYFKLMAELMKDNPPTKDDAPIVAKMAKIGLLPGKDFDISKLDPAVAKGLADAGVQSRPQLMTEPGRSIVAPAGSDQGFSPLPSFDQSAT